MNTETSMLNTLHIRHATMNDLKAVTQLLHIYYLSDYDWSFSEKSLLTSWQSPQFHLESDTWIVVTAEEKIVGYASIEPDGANSLTPSVCVLPDYRNRGIALALFQHIEEWMHSHLATKPIGAEVIALGRTSGRNIEEQQAFVENGYNLVRTFNIMEIELQQTPALPHWPEGITIRPFVRSKDEQIAYEVDEAAFRDDRDHSPRSFEAWQRRFGMTEQDFDPTLWHLAWNSEEIAGLVFGAVHSNRGWIEHVGVLRPWRKHGLGMALMQQILGTFYSRGLYTVGLNVDADSLTGANRLYERAGMYVKNQYLIYKKVIIL